MQINHSQLKDLIYVSKQGDFQSLRSFLGKLKKQYKDSPLQYLNQDAHFRLIKIPIDKEYSLSFIIILVHFIHIKLIRITYCEND